METSQPLPLPSGTVSIPVGEELTYRIQGSIDMYDRDNKIHRQGILTLTSHYIQYYIDNNKQNGLRWHLNQVVSYETEEGGLFGSAKIILKLRHFVQERSSSSSSSTVRAGITTARGTPSSSVTTTTVTTTTTSTTINTAYVKLSFKEGGRDAFVEDLKKALQRKAWIVNDNDDKDPLAGYAGMPEKKHRHNSNVPVPEPVVYRPGLQGVLDQRAKRMEVSKAIANEAFSDLDNLARLAKKIVTLAENYASESQRNKMNNNNNEGTTNNKSDDNASLGALISDMGIITPVTKEIAGKLYLQEVARQLITYIKPKLEKYGGIMTLTDVYCLYNRARGTEPISPEDLVEALRLAQKIGLGVRLRTFGGGNNSLKTVLKDTSTVSSSSSSSSSSSVVSSVFKPSSLLPLTNNGKKTNENEGMITVLQLDSFQDDIIQTRIIDILEKKEKQSSAALPWINAYVSAIELATEWHLPLTIIKQLLLQAEELGIICRDDSIAGLRFYLNHFLN